MPIKPMNILLIDDELDEASFFREALSSMEFTFNLFHSTGCDTVYQTLKLMPDIIFLDINMPQGCGLKLLEEIKANSKYKHIPVIMYSVSLKTEDIERSHSLGAHYYLVKPYAHLNFTESLKRLFKIDWTKPQPQPTLDNFVINLAFA